MKNINKFALSFATLATTIAPVATIISCGKKSQPSFFNYVDYISDTAKSKVEQFYRYTEFGDLPELETAIKNKSAPAGVGSDYYNVKLANEGLIQKIDFNSIFKGEIVAGKTFGELSSADIKVALQSLYTPEAWKLLQAFTLDSGKGELWEYMIPYFIQNKVVAFNPFKIAAASAGQEAALGTLKATNQNDIDALFTDKTYRGILNKLKEIGFNKLTVNNYMRDNLMIGSEASDGGFTGNLEEDTFADYIEAFDKTIHDFDSDADFIDSGFDSLMSIHSKSEENINSQVALLYNGDTLDAFNGYDQGSVEDFTHNAQIRYIVPENPSFLLDGVVIPTYINGADLDKVNEMLKTALYSHLTETNESKILTEGDINDYNMPLNNFDFVNYTTPFAAIYDWLVDADNYFADFEDGDIKVNTGEYAKGIFGTIKAATNKIDNKHVTSLIDNDLLDKVQAAYDSKFRNK